MPKLWNETIETHRSAVRTAILDTTAALVAGRGLSSVTMSQIAQGAGIGRATLYKYFPDVDAILTAWHERQIQAHLEQLARVRDSIQDPARRLDAVLEAYALMSQRHGADPASAQLHRAAHVGHAQQQLKDLIAELLTDGVRTGIYRNDVSPEELAGYCLHALDAASGLPSRSAVLRLVKVIRTGLEAPQTPQ
jgi:AcrR family transcriptional regulator